jgi:phage terminase large subunit-like protein
VFFSVLKGRYPSDAYVENKAENSVKFWNNSTVIFRHLDDIASLLGANLGGFYIDQAEEVDQEAFETLQGRLRRTNVPELKGLVTGNPRGHDWVYDKFGMAQGWNEDHHSTNWVHGTDYRMITAATHANRENLPANYIQQLKDSYSTDWFNRYVLGSWDGFADQIFAMEKITGYDTLPPMLMVLTACDPAISKENNACNTCFQTLGVGDDGFIYDLENVAAHWDFMEQLEQGGRIVSKHRTNYFGVEDVAYQRALAEALRHINPDLNVVDLKADRDKIRRARSVSHIIKQGKFRTNNRDLLAEMIAFEPDAKGKARKDRVDALVHALHMVQVFAPVVDKTVHDKPIHMEAKDSHDLWFKLTREQERKEMAGELEDENFSESNHISQADYY